MNNSGVVVGRVTLCALFNSRARAFTWNGSDATSTILGILPGGDYSQAVAINDQNFVAGSANMLVNGGMFGTAVRDRAFIHHAHFGMTALPLPPGYFPTVSNCGAAAISARNPDGRVRVVGYCLKGSMRRAVRWDVDIRKRLNVIPPVLISY